MAKQAPSLAETRVLRRAASARRRRRSWRPDGREHCTKCLVCGSLINMRDLG
jgi:hypothetical protein